MKSRIVFFGVAIIFLSIIALHTCRDYFEGKRPFTKGLYRKDLSGRISSTSIDKNRVYLTLRTSDSVYSFLPDRDPVRIGLSFWDAVHAGDSLWKEPMSDTIHTLDSKGIMYSWPFWTKDKFGRSYLSKEEVEQ